MSKIAVSFSRVFAVFAAIVFLFVTPAPAAPAPENTPDYFVEWVRSRGNLYVDTGVAGKVGVKAEMSFFHCSSSEFPVMLGAWGEENERFNLVMHNYNQCRWEYGSWDGLYIIYYSVYLYCIYSIYTLYILYCNILCTVYTFLSLNHLRVS